MENEMLKESEIITFKKKEILGRNLRFLRKSLGLKITDFALWLGISTNQLSRLENAEAYGISITAIFAIRKHASLDKFFNEDIEIEVRKATKSILQ